MDNFDILGQLFSDLASEHSSLHVLTSLASVLKNLSTPGYTVNAWCLFIPLVYVFQLLRVLNFSSYLNVEESVSYSTVKPVK
jgi:hypothetical protein